MAAKILKIFSKSLDKDISLLICHSEGGGSQILNQVCCHKLTSHANRPSTLVSDDRVMMLQNVNIYTKKRYIHT